MAEELREAVAGVVRQLTGEEADPALVDRILAEPVGEGQGGPTDLQRKQLGDIAARFEQAE